MSIALAKPGVTPEQLLALPDAIGFELIDGKLRERTLGSVSSYIGGTVFFLLRSHVRSHQLGWVFPADGGYQCWPDSPHTVRRPDVSFVRGDRLRDPKLPEGWLRITPDLVVEVVSPHDPMYEVEAKVAEYRAAGVTLIRVVIPPTRSVRVVRGDGSTVEVRGDEELSGEGVVPGFRCVVADFFQGDGPASGAAGG